MNKKPRTRSPRGKVVGRPRTRMEDLIRKQTRIQEPMRRYLRALSELRFDSMINMFDRMLEQFIEEKPWEHGLQWKRPSSAIQVVQGDRLPTAWKLINIDVRPALAERIQNSATTNGCTEAVFLYTAIHWWVQYMYPPKTSA